jgi:hypothetical protein
VLGPQQDRALFDKVLPKNVAVSCINRQVGNTPVDRGFNEVHGRGKWAIPWLEDDPGLTLPQLWVGRMRRDAADARRYGCDGLLGIHWRTRILAPNAAALAQAAWQQDAWNPDAAAPIETPREDGAVGGNVAAFPNNAIAGTDEAPVYQTVRYNLSAYHLRLPNGHYTVTLKFCEPHYAAAGKRVFQVALQGQRVLERLDIFERVGQNRALDFTYTNVMVQNGWLEVDFTPLIEFPSIAGIVVQGGVTRKINCGGPAYQDYEADKLGAAPGEAFPPVADFYRDWAAHEFGVQVGAAAADIFAGLDWQTAAPGRLGGRTRRHPARSATVERSETTVRIRRAVRRAATAGARGRQPGAIRLLARQLPLSPRHGRSQLHLGPLQHRARRRQSRRKPGRPAAGRTRNRPARSSGTRAPDRRSLQPALRHRLDDR